MTPNTCLGFLHNSQGGKEEKSRKEIKVAARVVNRIPKLTRASQLRFTLPLFTPRGIGTFQ
jgi:hypothetical protein